jgi:hypothetical protein
VKKEEAELLFFDPTGHGDARDPKGVREDAQAAAFLIGMQNLLAMSFGIGIGGRVFTATTPKAMTAIFLFALLFWLDCSILSTWQRLMYLITGKQEADQNFSVIRNDHHICNHRQAGS